MPLHSKLLLTVALVALVVSGNAKDTNLRSNQADPYQVIRTNPNQDLNDPAYLVRIQQEYAELHAQRQLAAAAKLAAYVPSVSVLSECQKMPEPVKNKYGFYINGVQHQQDSGKKLAFVTMKKKKNCFKDLAGRPNNPAWMRCWKIKPRGKNYVSFDKMKNKKNCFRDVARRYQLCVRVFTGQLGNAMRAKVECERLERIRE